MAHGIDRIDIADAGPGDIVSVAGLPEVTIGDTITDPGDPRPLPRLDVDAPTLQMTFGVNTSPLATSTVKVDGETLKLSDLEPEMILRTMPGPLSVRFVSSDQVVVKAPTCAGATSASVASSAATRCASL